MTQVGEGQEADESTPPGHDLRCSRRTGEILAERYELVRAHQQRQRRPAGLAGRRCRAAPPRRGGAALPGGDSATEMLQAAVAASRVDPSQPGRRLRRDRRGEPGLRRPRVGRRAIAAGTGRRRPVSTRPGDRRRHAIASALAAMHATGMVHGNVHPGTVMISDDGRVVLADARTDGADTQETDVRAVGGILYFALTGHWPHAEAPLTGSHRRARPGGPPCRRGTRRDRRHRGPASGPGRRAGLPRRSDDGSARHPTSRRPRRTCWPPSWAGSTCPPRTLPRQQRPAALRRRARRGALAAGRRGWAQGRPGHRRSAGGRPDRPAHRHQRARATDGRVIRRPTPVADPSQPDREPGSEEPADARVRNR